MEHTEAKKAAAADLISCILELKLTDKSFQKNLMRFFQKYAKLIHQPVPNALQK